MPIFWYIIKLYCHHAFNKFIVCAGYKQHVIKEYFADYFLHRSDVIYYFTSGRNEMAIYRNSSELWKVTVVDTGLNTMTGGRVRRVRDYIDNEPFMLTYGDGVSDLEITELVTWGSQAYIHFVTRALFASFSQQYIAKKTIP